MDALFAAGAAILGGLTIWLTFGTLAFTDATGGRRIGLLPNPLILALSIAA